LVYSVVMAQEQQIRDISHTTIEKIIASKWKWLFLVVLPSAVLDIFIFRFSGYGLSDPEYKIMALLLPWLAIGLFWYAKVNYEVRIKFWQQFARRNGWKYSKTSALEHEEALVFAESKRRTKITNTVRGEIYGLPARIFESSFTIRKGRDYNTFHYINFGFRFNGYFPHLYLNRLDNVHNIKNSGVRIRLPTEFEKKFHLYGPIEYEMEALEIFTPDVLQSLLGIDWPHDIELVDQELLIFRPGGVNNQKELEKEFSLATKLRNYLAPKLNRVRFNKIGDYPELLSRNK
jgi:hypothetical protein